MGEANLKSIGSSTKKSVKLLCWPSSGLLIISRPLTIVKLSIFSRLISDDNVCCPMHLMTLGFGLRIHWLNTSLFALIKINLEIHTNNTINDRGTIFEAIFSQFWLKLFLKLIFQPFTWISRQILESFDTHFPIFAFFYHFAQKASRNCRLIAKFCQWNGD